MTSTEALVSARGLTKHYRVAGRRRLTAVDGVDLEVAAGQVHAVVGESGCGKSTTGRLLLGLETPSAGEVRFDGRPLAERSAAQMRALRRELQVVFQDPYDVLNPRMKVEKILREPARVHGQEGTARPVPDLLELVNLSPDFAQRYPHELSGGQRQRIAIARAIALDPRFVVCDEPVSALDVSVQAQVINLLRRLQDELGLAYLFISHDLALVRYLAGTTTVMYLGRVVEQGPTEALFADPRHPYTQLLLAAVPRVRGARSATSTEVRRLGELPSPLDTPPGCVFASRCPLADERCRTVRPPLRDVNGHQVACHYAETAQVVAA